MSLAFPPDQAFTAKSPICNFIDTIKIEADEHQILQWLSPLEPLQRHQDVRTNRYDSVGNWVLETSEFRKWRDAEEGCVEPVLFCYGNPGVGKTYVSSLVIDSLSNWAMEKNIAVSGVYCDFLAQQEQSTTNMFGAILKQLFNIERVPEHIREAFQKAKEFGSRVLGLLDVVEILKRTIASLAQVYICIDALDEFTPKRRRELLESVKEIVRVSPKTRVFLTGSPHIGDQIMNCFGEAVQISLSPTHKDIGNYLEMKLCNDPHPNAMDDELRANIMKIIPEKIPEISFLLASLGIDAVLGEITLDQRREKLDSMTKGRVMGDAYAAILSRIKAQPEGESTLGMGVLMWVSHAEQPLHVDELCHALGVGARSIDLNTRNIPTIETLLECSLGLVTVEKSSSTVRFIHSTLQEYLSHNPNSFPEPPHSKIAEVCLTYLNFRYIRSLSPALRSAPPAAPFLIYASCYWGAHAAREPTDNVISLALKLLYAFDKHISSKMLLLRGVSAEEQPFDPEDTPRGFTGLHGAAYLGCAEIVIALLKANRGDVQAKDFNGNTAIAWAARRGHEGVVEALLQLSDVNPDTVDTTSGQTPLLLAAKNGHEGVVRVLLELKEVNPNKADKWSQTPLLLAAENEREGVVGILLQRKDVSYDKADDWSQAPLLRAAENGYEGIVRMLLEQKGVNPGNTNKWSQTPLALAAKNGHAAVVRMLLERSDADPDKADSWTQTPLLLAAENGHERVVKMLVKRKDVNANKADDRGRTPLSLASANGHEKVVRALLDCNASPDIADTTYGQTPLSWSAMRGHETIVKILLERGGASPDKRDKRDRTPLAWALENGHERIAKLLQE